MEREREGDYCTRTREVSFYTSMCEAKSVQYTYTIHMYMYSTYTFTHAITCNTGSLLNVD